MPNLTRRNSKPYPCRFVDVSGLVDRILLPWRATRNSFLPTLRQTCLCQFSARSLRYKPLDQLAGRALGRAFVREELLHHIRHRHDGQKYESY